MFCSERNYYFSMSRTNVVSLEVSSETKQRLACQVIADLINASRADALVPLYDGGVTVDVVYSLKRPRHRMTLKESESLMDAAIRAAWVALTGDKLKAEDPVTFVLEGADACRS